MSTSSCIFIFSRFPDTSNQEAPVAEHNLFEDYDDDDLYS